MSESQVYVEKFRAQSMDRSEVLTMMKVRFRECLYFLAIVVSRLLSLCFLLPSTL